MVNIFHLDPNPRICAKWYFNKHVIKIICEIAQMTSTAIRYNNKNNQNENLYKSTHINHPMSIWVRQTRSNFIWALVLATYLVKEHTFRYPKSKQHASFKVILKCFELRHLIPKGKYTKPPYCMPEKYIEDDIYQSYKMYYCGEEKRKLADWKNREKPFWFK